MNNLKLNSLLLVGDSTDKEHFMPFFKEVALVNNNSEAMKKYTKISAPIILLYCKHQDASLKVVEQIREKDNATIIIVSTDTINMEILLEALPLNVFSFVERPFNELKVYELLLKLEKRLSLQMDKFILLKEHYRYSINKEVLYDGENQKVHLTKHEVMLMNLFITEKDNFLTSEFIEHSLWEKESQEADCNKRLKTLLYLIKKKLPKDSIENAYGVGYRLVYRGGVSKK